MFGWWVGIDSGLAEISNVSERLFAFCELAFFVLACRQQYDIKNSYIFHMIKIGAHLHQIYATS